jgi:cell division protein FtsI (penicillin-binding protein 3)
MSKIRRNKSAQFGGNGRLLGVWLVLGIGAFGLLLRLVWLQIIDAPNLQQKAQAQQSVTVRPFVPRRTIVDRANNQVAIDRPSYTIYAHPVLFSELKIAKGKSKNGTKVQITPADMAQRLAPILGGNWQDLAAKFQQRNTGVLLAAGLSEEIGNQIRALKLEGLDIQQSKNDYTRFYPQENMLAEILGYVGFDVESHNRQAKAGVEYSQSLLLKREVKEYNLTRTGKGDILPDRVTPDYLHTDDLSLLERRSAAPTCRQKSIEAKNG